MSEQKNEKDGIPENRPCYRCGKDPAEGFASVWTAKDGERWYCHGDDDESPTCYESAHICPECGRPVDRESDYPYWVEPETKQRHHDPCPMPDISEAQAQRILSRPRPALLRTPPEQPDAP